MTEAERYKHEQRKMRCLACGRKFTLGEAVVLARGKWQGLKYIHEDEAIFDEKTGAHCERGHHATAKQGLVEQG